MSDGLEEEYPEAAPYIQKAVEEHGEDWVIENYYPKFSQLGLVMDVPEVEQLPFFNKERHETMSEEERIEMAEALSDYRENLREAGKDE